MMREEMTNIGIKRMEERFDLTREAVKLLGIIAAEFSSDPTSVQCFDARIVERAIYVSKRLYELRIF